MTEGASSREKAILMPRDVLEGSMDADLKKRVQASKIPPFGVSFEIFRDALSVKFI